MQSSCGNAHTMPKTFFLWQLAELKKLGHACQEWFPVSKGEKKKKKMGAGGEWFPKCLTFLGKGYVTDSRKYHSNQRPSSRPPVRGCEARLFLCVPFLEWCEGGDLTPLAHPPIFFFLSQRFTRLQPRNAWKKTNSWRLGKEMLVGVCVCEHTHKGRREAPRGGKKWTFCPLRERSLNIFHTFIPLHI